MRPICASATSPDRFASTNSSRCKPLKRVSSRCAAAPFPAAPRSPSRHRTRSHVGGDRDHPARTRADARRAVTSSPLRTTKSLRSCRAARARAGLRHRLLDADDSGNLRQARHRRGFHMTAVRAGTLYNSTGLRAAAAAAAKCRYSPSCVGRLYAGSRAAAVDGQRREPADPLHGVRVLLVPAGDHRDTPAQLRAGALRQFRSSARATSLTHRWCRDHDAVGSVRQMELEQARQASRSNRAIGSHGSDDGNQAA